eukprot:GHVN01013839.1.p2 GENE.GHVN01013839.1~~GHVN01013839.1.p2  ORF type:complete len:156 (+),score=22.17 GHVN01013839.1:691-1158(+)
MFGRGVTDQTLLEVAKNKLIPRRKGDWVHVWDNATGKWRKVYSLVKRNMWFVLEDERSDKLLFSFMLEGTRVSGMSEDEALRNEVVSYLPELGVGVIRVAQNTATIIFAVDALKRSSWEMALIEGGQIVPERSKGSALSHENLALSNKVFESYRN